MPVASEDVAQRAMDLAARLRAVQAAASDQPEDTRLLLIERELDKAAEGMTDQVAREVFNRALDEFTLTTAGSMNGGSSLGGADRGAGNASSGGAAAKDDAIALASRLAKAWGTLTAAERDEIGALLIPLIAPGTLGASEREAVVGPIIAELRTSTGPGLTSEDVVPARVGELAAALFRLAFLSPTLWEQWEEILADLRRPRGAPSIPALAPAYLKAKDPGDAACRNMAQEVIWVSKVLNGLVVGTKTKVTEFAKDHVAEFAPSKIEAAVGGWNTDAKAWARYKEMMAEASKETIAEDILDRIRRRCTGK